MNNQARKIIDYVNSQIGYKETPENITKYAAEINQKWPDFYNGSKGDGKTWGCAWCDVFVDYAFLHEFGEEEALRLLCQPKRSAGAGCKYSRQYYEKAGRLFKDPQPGDQIFFGPNANSNHTGIVTKVEDGRVYTVEGNSGNAVKSHSYALNNTKINGYGRPRWNEAQAAEPAPAPAPAPAVQDPTPAPALQTTKPNNSDVYYTVKKGDTLSKIAGIFSTTVKELQAINKIANPNLIYPGEMILLPSKNGGSAKPAAPQTFIGRVNTKAQPLNVRSGAGTIYKIVRQLPKGSTIELYRTKKNGWFQLTDGSGFVSANYIIEA